MSLSKIIGSLATIAALALLVPQVTAQHELHRGMPIIDPDGNNPDLWQPFVDPTAFPHDFQFFAPAEFGEFGNGPQPPTGWFGTADRVHIRVSRPEAEPTRNEADFTWGNRFTLGYMSPENHGWFGEFWHINGPNVFNITEAERVNVLEPDDEINGDPDNIDLRGGGGGGTGGGVNPIANTGVPASDMNNPVSQDRRYYIRDSLNDGELSSLELNKSYRWKQLHYGSHFEPFFGFRYISFTDHWQQDAYSRITDLGVDVGQVPPLAQDPTLLQNERFDQTISAFDNHLVGGQFGARWYKVKGRWNLSGEIRAFLFTNFQFQETYQSSELTFYDATGVDEPPEGVFLSNNYSYGNATEFVFGGEARAEAAFEVTRDIAIRAGITFMEFGDGIGRGNTITANNENLTMFGTTFGIDIRR